MELVNHLFPDPDWVSLNKMDFSSRPESVGQQEFRGMIKEWKVQGLVSDEALGHLNELNTREGMEKVFEKVYSVTGAESLKLDRESRNLLVNLVASENKRYDPENPVSAATRLPFQFNLTITQRISQDDSLAISTASIK